VRAIVADVAPDARITVAQVRRGMRAVDVDHDGRQDYLFSFARIPGWCGTGGCRTQLWVQRRGMPPRKVFDAQVREAAFRNVRGHTVADFDLHGSACHSFGASACPASFVWDASLGRLVEHAAPGGDGVIRYLRPMKSVDPPAPLPVMERYRATLSLCASAGGTAADADPPLTVPDLDGDGVRDWIIPEIFCDRPGEADDAPVIPMTLFATAGNPARPMEVARGRRVEISVSTTPATVFLIEGPRTCDLGEEKKTSCRRVEMRWNRAAKRLEPLAR